MRETGDKTEKHQMAGQADQEGFASKQDDTKADAGKETQSAAPRQAIAEIGGPKKRKQAKIIGGEDTPEDAQPLLKPSRKPKQTKKKVKLSFDDV